MSDHEGKKHNFSRPISSYHSQSYNRAAEKEKKKKKTPKVK